MNAILFERPWVLVPTLVVLQGILVGIWSLRRTRAMKRAVRFGFVIAPTLVILQSVVVTRHERLIAACQSLADAVESGRLQTVRTRLTEDFSADGLDREAFMGRLERALARYHPSDVVLYDFDFVSSSESDATVEFTSMCDADYEGAYLRRISARWRLGMVDDDGRWQVASVEVVPTGASPIAHLRDLTR